MSGRDQFALSYELSPIVLTGGIAAALPGGLMPIISITEGKDYDSIASGSQAISPQNAFAHFQPVPGATAIDNEIGQYPFANQSVAANAIIAQPLRISMLMICPPRGSDGYAVRGAVFAALQSQLAKHNNLGGTYTIATPALIYTDCIMTNMRDVTSGSGNLAQVSWQMDFVRPLLTLEAARAAQNSLMSKIGAGVATTGDPPSWSGQEPAVGLPGSGQGPSTVGAATPLPAASVGSNNLPRSIPV